MFTGIIESTGTITKIQACGDQARWTVAIPFSSKVQLGDSVAINGCCLTVAEFTSEHCIFDLLKQTLDITALQSLGEGSVVNLERALSVGDRLGGHFVQGHVDAVGTVLGYTQEGQDHRYEVELPASISRYCIAKGSLCLDGISLTMAELTPLSAVFWITPHTHQGTNLEFLKMGDRVNLEADLLAKYLEKLHSGN